MYEIWMDCQCHPYDGITNSDVYYMVTAEEPELCLPETCEPFYLDLMKRCFNVDPQERPSGAQIAKSIYRYLESQ